MKIQYLLYSVLLFSLSSVQAEPMSGIIEMYEKAVQKDASIAAERAAAIAGLEKETQGFSQLLPQISAGGNIRYSYSKTTYQGIPRLDNKNSSDSSGLDLQLIQPLFHLVNHTAYSQSKIATKSSAVQLTVAEQDLILRVVKAYFDILSADDSFSVAKSQTLAFKENLERAKLTFEIGTATKTDKLEAQARYDLARASELTALNQLAISQQTMASIIGEEPNKLRPLNKKTFLLQVEPQDMQHWVDTAISENLTLKLSRLNVETAKLEIKRLKNDRYPVIDIVARTSYGRQYIAFGINTDTANIAANIGLQLSMPIYTGGLMTSRIREAEALRTQQKFNTSDLQRQVVLQTQQAYLTAKNGFQQIKALKQASISSNSALQATRKGMEVGVRTNLDLLNSQQQFFETELDYTVARYNYLITVLNLKSAAGNLSTEDIEVVESFLDK